MAAFVWGKNGEKLTPEDVERQRLASAMMYKQGADFSPAGHWSEALGRAFNGWASGRLNKIAGKGEEAGLASADEAIAALLAGRGGAGYAAPSFTASSSGAPAPAAAPQGPEYPIGVDALPQSPTTPGGYSLGTEIPAGVDPAIAAQFAIPEEVKNGIFAGESGGDYDALFGFQNRPGGKFQNVKLTDMTVDQALQFAAPSGEYGQTVKGQIGRVATPMGAYQIVGTTLKAAKDGLGLTGNEVMTPELQDALGGWILANQGTGAWEGYKGPRDGYTPASGGAVTMSTSGTGGGYGGGGTGGVDIASLLALQKNPWVAKKYGGVVDALMGQQFSRQNALWEQQQKMADPMYQAQLEMAQLELDKAQAPQAPKPIEVGGVLLDPTTFQPIFDSRTPAAGDGGFTLGQGQQRFDANGNLIASVDAPPPDPTVPTTKNVTLADGSEALVQWNPETSVWDPAPIPQGGTSGAGLPTTKLTESQARITLFETLQNETAPVLTQIESIWDPANISDAVARSTPIAGNFFTTEEGQMYASASSAWAEGALRISTGAAATEPEIQRIQKTYFAQPGDTPAVVEFKRGMRDMYDRAIQASLGKDTSGQGSLVLPEEFAKAYTSANPPPAALPVDGGSDMPPPPGVDPVDWQFMTLEEKALFK